MNEKWVRAEDVAERMNEQYQENTTKNGNTTSDNKTNAIQRQWHWQWPDRVREKMQGKSDTPTCDSRDHWWKVCSSNRFLLWHWPLGSLGRCSKFTSMDGTNQWWNDRKLYLKASTTAPQEHHHSKINLHQFDSIAMFVQWGLQFLGWIGHRFRVNPSPKCNKFAIECNRFFSVFRVFGFSAWPKIARKLLAIVRQTISMNELFPFRMSRFGWGWLGRTAKETFEAVCCCCFLLLANCLATMNQTKHNVRGSPKQIVPRSIVMFSMQFA